MQFENNIFGGGWQGVETGAHNGKFSDWSYDFYIKSYGPDFLTQLAKSVLDTGRGNLAAIPVQDCLSVLQSLVSELTRKYTDAKQTRAALMADLKARNEDWVQLCENRTYAGANPVSSEISVSNKVCGPFSASVLVPVAQLKWALPKFWFYVNPYCLSADGWLLQVGTALDLPAASAPLNTWKAGYTGITAAKNFNPDGVSVWGDASLIFDRAETYSRVRAFEYALSLRLEAANQVQALLNAGNLAGVKAASEVTVSSPYDFWTVTELPNAIQYVNPLLALNPLTLATVVDVPFTPDAAKITQAPDGSLNVQVDSKYANMDALAAFRTGISPLQTLFVQPRYVTPGEKTTTASKKSPVLALAAAGLALYFMVKQ